MMTFLLAVALLGAMSVSCPWVTDEEREAVRLAATWSARIGKGSARHLSPVCMTEEYLIGERYHDCDPWFFPWCPNASGAGRIVQMILELGAP